jgi:hypothetical protein
MRSTLATDVPPNFMTRKGMTTRVSAPKCRGLCRGLRHGPRQPATNPILAA